MTATRRTTIFIDGSAFRDTLRKAYFDRFRRLEETIDYHAFGQFLCAADEQLVRVNYYTGEPVEITETIDESTGKPRPMMGRIELGDHEAHRAQRVLDGHRRFVRHIEGCRYTRLVTGRVVAHRRPHRYGEAFAWAQQVLVGVGDGREMLPADRGLFDEAVKANQAARDFRQRLAVRLEEIREQKNVPLPLLPRFTEYASMLRDESISFQEKGVDTLLTVEMMEGCLRDNFDVAILFAADEDYVPLVEAVKRDGRRVVHAFLDGPTMGAAFGRLAMTTGLSRNRISLPLHLGGSDPLTPTSRKTACRRPKRQVSKFMIPDGPGSSKPPMHHVQGI